MKADTKKTKKGFSQVGDLFSSYKLDDKGGYITQEFQDFGYQMAVKLNDLKRTSMYMRMSKNIPRGILEQAMSFVSDAHQARSKAALFMWKVKELRKSKKELEKDNKVKK
jgi:hypothetical protein